MSHRSKWLKRLRLGFAEPESGGTEVGVYTMLLRPDR